MIGILRSAFILVAAIAIVGGGTYAYFSTTDQSMNNTLAMGTLDIDLLKQNTSDPLTFSVSNLLPGGEALVAFDVKNNSATGVQIRGAAYGNWISVSGGVDTLMKVTKVERWNNATTMWDIISSTTPVTGIFYDSSDGTVTGTYKTIGPGEKGQFRLTVKLDESAGDIYQGKNYNASVKVQARQDGATSWPTDLMTGF